MFDCEAEDINDNVRKIDGLPLKCSGMPMLKPTEHSGKCHFASTLMVNCLASCVNGKAAFEVVHHNNVAMSIRETLNIQKHKQGDEQLKIVIDEMKSKKTKDTLRQA